MREAIINLAYILAATLFILGLKGLSHPRTAVRANLQGALGMLIAIVATLVDRHIVGFKLILLGGVVGSGLGAAFALRAKMTGMPQMVALLNGFGGLASVLVAGAAIHEALHLPGDPSLQMTIATGLSGLIGVVTWWGSLVAWAKLEGVMSEKSVAFPGQQVFNGLLLLAALALTAMLAHSPYDIEYYWLICGIATILGFTLILPVGGADMPVVIALLNSYSGMAGAATGFVLNNYALIIAGSLVGSSGIILTNIMCKAMNRSLANVMTGKGTAAGAAARAEDVYAGRIKSVQAEEVAMIFDGAQYVVIVPGYGMAVAQAQHAVAQLAAFLEARGCTVEYAIHPVAGRMPGHMNVLLAEANVPYDKMKEMDEINPSFAQVDVALVIGANDVVNPVARTDPKSPIAGMPILDVDKAKTVIVMKRSLSPGFAGIPNPLFAADNTLMYFADGKQGVLEILNALKQS
ncbi:MAG TPA: NAD(P)(+) transhydrogenase (Re/Si-specific) subunit beta [bacterium]|nr:NAD(P)(+) transhydrogenase (Re/Si-specific) subunit beta [bacterium]